MNCPGNATVLMKTLVSVRRAILNRFHWEPKDQWPFQHCYISAQKGLVNRNFLQTNLSYLVFSKSCLRYFNNKNTSMNFETTSDFKKDSLNWVEFFMLKFKDSLQNSCRIDSELFTSRILFNAIKILWILLFWRKSYSQFQENIKLPIPACKFT